MPNLYVPGEQMKAILVPSGLVRGTVSASVPDTEEPVYSKLLFGPNRHGPEGWQVHFVTSGCEA
jgi:hypothetical protein